MMKITKVGSYYFISIQFKKINSYNNIFLELRSSIGKTMAQRLFLVRHVQEKLCKSKDWVP